VGCWHVQTGGIRVSVEKRIGGGGTVVISEDTGGGFGAREVHACMAMILALTQQQTEKGGRRAHP